MTAGEIFALAPTLSPLIVLIVYMVQQSRRDNTSLSSTWAGIAPELLNGVREDMKIVRADAEAARADAKEARKEAHEARLLAMEYQDKYMKLQQEFHLYRMNEEARYDGD